jgi:hypothetical protein
VYAKNMPNNARLQNVDNLILAELYRQSLEDEQFWSSPKNDRREQAHSFFQYPAMMVPSVQRTLVEIFYELQPNITNMMDPFVGAGTTITAGMCNGLDCYGQDINPLAVLVTRVKTGPFFIDAMTEYAAEVICKSREDISEKIEVEFNNIDKWFRKDVQIELSKLRRAIRTLKFVWARRFMWVTLAEVIRLTSNDRTSTFKLHMRSKDDIQNRIISPIGVFARLVQQNLDDLNRFNRFLRENGFIKRGYYTGNIEIAIGDTAKNIFAPEKKAHKQYDLLVTSPPYGDNVTTITYGQHSYLQLQWIDINDLDAVADDSFLLTTHEIDRRSLGGIRNRHLQGEVAKLSQESKILAGVFNTLSTQPRERTSRVVAFYSDFFISLNNIVNSLANNAYLLWTIGNRSVGGIEMPNDRILEEYLSAMNVNFVARVERKIHQKRMPSRNQSVHLISKENILIFRKNG